MRFFRTLHFLSIDVVLGAVSLHMMIFHALLHVWPRWEYDALLGISVYLIYGIDRQIDNLSADVSDELHVFHAKYRCVLISLMLALVCVNIVLLYRIEMELVRFGIALLFLLGGYWAAWVKGIFTSCWGSKEIFTAAIYSMGVLLPSTFNADFPFDLGFVLFLLALLNLWLFTFIATGGKPIYIQALIGLSLLGIILLAYCVNNLFVNSLLLLIWGIHVGIYYFRPRMSMRPWAEWAFVSPIIYILCNL